ncbi:MAG TPA: type II toxin-antitoxin system HicA family toxin [Deltaproteobacteria bacterium]|nr:type II toxin-antitoxin system HicA family toxin [Deltaproteobacteria bacterium]
MKRKDLIKELEKMGCILIRHGGKHDWYHNPRTKISQPVPRHKEINEYLAKHIIKMLKNPT